MQKSRFLFLVPVLCCVACGGGSAAAGDPIGAWAARAGGEFNDSALAIASFADGSTVATGYVEGDVTFGAGEANETMISSVSRDVFLARYNPDGSLAWVRHAEGAGDEYGFGVETVADGSVVVTGSISGDTTFGAGERAETTLGSGGGMFVARYAADGSLQWARSAGGASRTVGYAIDAYADGSTVVAGSFFNGDATFGEGEPGETTLSTTSTSVFVARYAADGSLVWARSTTGGGAPEGYGAAALGDGSCVVAGSFHDAVTLGEGEPNATTLLSAGGQDVFVARFNPDGSLAWARSAGGAQGDEAYAIASYPDGSFVITGMTDAESIFGAREPNETRLVSAGGGDAFVARYNADGSLAWARAAGGADDDYGLGIATLADGSIVVGGAFCEAATFGAGEAAETTVVAAGRADAFLARFRADGSLAGVESAGGADYDEIDAVTAFADGFAAAAGYFTGEATFDAGGPHETTLVSAGFNDAFIARFDAGAGR